MRVLKRIWQVLEVIIFIYVIFMTILFLGKNKYGFTQLGKSVLVNVDSYMSHNVHNVKKGDLLIIKDNGKLKKRDIFYFYYVNNDKYSIKSEKLEKVKSDIYIADNGHSVSSSRFIGNKGFSIPLLGFYLAIVESRVGFILLVFLPIFLVFMYQIYEFIFDIRKNNKMIESNKKVDSEVI